MKNIYKDYPRFIKRWNGNFYKALITEDSIFFCNYNEGDDNGNVEMYNRKMELLSDNYFASNELQETLKIGKWEYISPTMKLNYELALEAGQFLD
jgi:hypothetical protein